MYQILLVSIVVISGLLIFLVLMQQGKGADAGAAFGSGASGTVFGAQGTGTFLSRLTSILAAIFFVVCLAMAWLISSQTAGNVEQGSVMDSVIQDTVQDLPSVPGAGGAAVQLPKAGAVPADLPTTIAPQANDLPTTSDVQGAVDLPSAGDLPAAGDLPSAGTVVNEGLEGPIDIPTVDVPVVDIPVLEAPVVQQ